MFPNKRKTCWRGVWNCDGFRRCDRAKLINGPAQCLGLCLPCTLHATWSMYNGWRVKLWRLAVASRRQTRSLGLPCQQGIHIRTPAHRLWLSADRYWFIRHSIARAILLVRICKHLNRNQWDIMTHITARRGIGLHSSSLRFCMYKVRYVLRRGNRTTHLHSQHVHLR